MWNLTLTGDARIEDYGAYTSICDNIISFIIYYEFSPNTYVELIEENRTMFTARYDSFLKLNVVEPRELLYLLNHLDDSDRLSWAPRLFRRTGFLEKDFLFFCPENKVFACLFCGSRCKIASDSFLKLDPFFSVDLQHPERIRQQWFHISDTRYFHFHNCPLVWLDRNCEWYMSNDHSKFNYALHALEQTNDRIMNSELEWIGFTRRVGEAKIMGACEKTVCRLFRKVIEMKLKKVDGSQNMILRNSVYSMRFEKYADGNDSKRSQKCLAQIIDSGKKFTFGSTQLIFAIDSKLAWKTFVMHGFCVEQDTFLATSDFWEKTATVSTTMDVPLMRRQSVHGNSTVPNPVMTCLYCNHVFDGKLCDPTIINSLYNLRDQRMILEYLLYSTSLPLSTTSNFNFCYWERTNKLACK